MARSPKSPRSPCKTVDKMKKAKMMQLVRETKTRLYKNWYYQKLWIKSYGATTPCTVCRDPKDCKSQATRVACVPCKKANKSISCSRHADALVHTIRRDHAEYSEESIRRVIRRMEQQESKRPSATPRSRRKVTPPRAVHRSRTKVEAGMDIDNEAFSPTQLPATPIRATTRQCATPPPSQSQAPRNVQIGDHIDRDGWTKEDYQKAYLHTKRLLIAQENANTELGEQKRRFYADWKDKQAANEIRIATLENNNSALVDENEVLKRANQDLRDEVKLLKQKMADKDNEARNEKLRYTENTLNELKEFIQKHGPIVDRGRNQAIVTDEDEIVSPEVMLWRNKYNNELVLKRERRLRLFNDLRQIDLLYGQLQKSLQKRKVTACELRGSIQGHLEELSRWVTVLNRAEGFR